MAMGPLLLALMRWALLRWALLSRGLGALALLGAWVAVLGACAAAPSNAWTELSLPGPATRLLRDAVACGGRWYVVGGRAGPDGETSPAAWDSADGHTWRGVTLAPLPGSYYGPRSVLYAVACAGDRIAAIGARSGGVHGNPRISTWYQRPDGSLAEAAASFETYGGSTAVDVGRVAGGPSGFLLAGNRTSGAAAWLSADGTSFRLFENAPGLAHGFARDGAVLAGRFVLVGSLGDAPAAWSSADGTSWQRADVPAGDDGGAASQRADVPDAGGFAELQRVVPVGTRLVAVGRRGDTFGAWLGPERAAVAGRWTAAGRFGEADVAGIRSLTVAGGRLYAAAGGLWRSVDGGRSWLTVITPRGAKPLSAVAARDDHVLLIAGDRAWLARGV